MNRDRSCPSDSIDIAAPQDAGGRLQTLDLLRGLTLISMIIYHGMWDFLYLSESGASMTALRTWYEGGGHLWQQSICRTFILLSGFCVPFSRHIFRRGLQISAGGAAVSAVTEYIKTSLWTGRQHLKRAPQRENICLRRGWQYASFSFM